MLARTDNQHDHPLATGRRFILRLPPPFSSRLSRNSRPTLQLVLAAARDIHQTELPHRIDAAGCRADQGLVRT
jgi:hypothetical protein